MRFCAVIEPETRFQILSVVVEDSEPYAKALPNHSRQLPWAVRHRYPKNRLLRRLSWIWSNPLTIAIPSQIDNRRADVVKLIARLGRRS